MQISQTHTVPQDSRPSETYVYREEGVYLRVERGHVGAVGMGITLHSQSSGGWQEWGALSPS